LLLVSFSTAAKSKSRISAPPQPATSLEAVLKQMDAAAAQFRNAEADFKADNYEKVVNETDTQTGKIYFRRTSKGEMQMASQIQSPDEKEVVYADGKIRVYQPKIAQVNEYDAGKNRSEIESFLVLGFGGGGRELQQQFEVQLAGDEDVNGVKTAKLELSPKDPKVKNMFDRIVIWIDPVRAISLKQQFFEPSGNYRLTYYSNIRLNTKISDDVFKLHTTGHTKTVKGS
jgi:outer membrane lipoprotein-sorting protein